MDGVYRPHPQDQSMIPYKTQSEEEMPAYQPDPRYTQMQPQPEMDPNDPRNPNNPNNPNNPRRRQNPNPNQRRQWRARPFEDGGTQFRRNTVDPSVSITS